MESNVFFLLGTWADRMLARRAGALSPGVRVPIALGASVGVGSILWHTYPTMPTLVLNIVPILVFISWFIWLYTRNVVGMRPPFAAASVAVFLLATFLTVSFSGVLHGAPVYTPGLVAMGLVVLAFTNADTETTRTTLAAVAVGIVGAIAGMVSQGPRPPTGR